MRHSGDGEVHLSHAHLRPISWYVHPELPNVASCSLPNFAMARKIGNMTTMNISLPDSLKDFVDEQVAQHGYGTSSAYVRELIRRDHDRTRLRELLLEGAGSPPGRSNEDLLRGVRARIARRTR